ncbi:DNA polymerase III subunit gamma/tau [Acholeplasma hippikon]|uniref:DNA polymerase III subunit gamma/tau n=1 Tax=Acholeplasma hippikon TaxID=264636 RepID=A0A449BKU5_9MOLU|nr:DNA polymerase III subunit gamma/tau [Acholeplasma hippikon]VEU83054.1 DNA-directed DNA polymerase [Acholeplasma hippikon]
MSYVALYRTYRPKTFSEVYGQKVVVQTLQNALKNNKFGHAYIFSGPRGTGKTSIAKIVAKALNCEKAPIADPCGECSVCKGIDKGDVPDIIEIDAASNNGVDEIRDLRDKVKYAPSVGKYKVYIIDEVHMLTTAAFNALLKTLEEPPKYVVFILATTEIHKVPATILSRCQRFDFKNIDSIDIENNIRKIADKENLKITDDAIYAIAQTSEGGMRDALSLLDQVVSFSENEISEEDVYKVSGGLSKRFITELLNYIIDSKPQKALDFLNRVLSEGKDITRMVSDLILALRDILLDKIKDETKYPELKHLSTQRIYAYLDILNNLQQDLKYTTTKRAYLELAILKMINHESINLIELETKIDTLKQQLHNLEDKLNKQPVVEVVKEPVKEKVQEVKQNRKPLVTVKEIEEILNNGDREKRALLKKGWDALKDYDQPLLKGVAELLSEGSLEAVGNNKMLIVYDDFISAHAMLKPDVKEKVLQIINSKSNLIKDYTVLLKPDWLRLKSDYAEQYNVGTTKPKLKPIDLHLYEVFEGETVEEQAKDPLVSFAEEYFGKELVKVEE